jgi:hypothetical protein
VGRRSRPLRRRSTCRADDTRVDIEDLGEVWIVRLAFRRPSTDIQYRNSLVDYVVVIDAERTWPAIS